MRSRAIVSIALIVVLTMISGCGESNLEIDLTKAPVVEPSQIPSQEFTSVPSPEPVEKIAVVEMIEKTTCFSGPGTEYEAARFLAAGQYFDVIGIDDDITWIDDDITWFQINPNLLVDPEPPHRDLSELSPQPDPPGSEMVFRCWVPENSVGFSGDVAELPVIPKPVLVIMKGTSCYSGPGLEFQAVGSLEVNNYHDIVGIDDDITWADQGAIMIDDDITWFQIDPNAMVDPDPPHRPLEDLALSSDPSGKTVTVLCWVNRDAVDFSGDLSRVPVIPKSIMMPSPIPPTTKPIIKTPTLEPSPTTFDCSNYTTYTTCMQQSNLGCAWDDKVGCYQK